MMSNTAKAFNTFTERLSSQDDTWKFWCQFVFEDCLSYVALYIAIRCKNWNLRVLALKMMAPLFAAYDRTTYQQLIPHHLADIQTFPDSVIQSLQAGAFAVCIVGGKGHAVALDEAHEMCINKDMKYAVVRPSKAYLQKTSLFLRFRIMAYKNILSQLFPATICKRTNDVGIYSDKPELKKAEENIHAIINNIEEMELFPACRSSNRGLVNVFSGQKATPEQAHDLLNFRRIGSEHLEQYIRVRILQQPSTNAPRRKHRLLTMACPKLESKKRVSQRERELKQVTKCLRQRLAWCNRTGQTYDPSDEQYSAYPRAICTETGAPHKGSKAVWTDKLEKRYAMCTSTPVILHTLPREWVPEIVILDANTMQPT